MVHRSSFVPATAALIALVYLLSLSAVCEAASFEDTRCKCVCDKTWDASGKETRAVFTNTTRSEQCDCEHVVKPLAPFLSCSRCLCRTETRNTTTIKVVVIFIICVVSLLFVYMLFLLCLDPLIQRRPTSYQQHTNEESRGVPEEDMSSGPRTEDAAATTPTGAGPSPQAMSARQRSLLNMVSKEQKKWKGTVQEQRKNIYDRHSMLN
ncbi:transmembrane protein 9 isoform X2 [Aplysia californica]|uniref:Transmembrane protein 9 isoform X2 n=1 Tax=Aplysia californica TaxID=6500 RepID=A0ABM0K4N8_APLCA|nr:transmembrane protein 9 isoform X2 [Aplysia californica]